MRASQDIRTKTKVDVQPNLDISKHRVVTTAKSTTINRPVTDGAVNFGHLLVRQGKLALRFALLPSAISATEKLC